MSRTVAFAARLVRALLAFAVLAGFTAGVPWLLTSTTGWPLDWIGWPTPSPVPSLTDLATAVTTPWSDQMIFALLASIGWVLWLLFVRDLLVESIETSMKAAATRRGLPQPADRRRGPIRWAAAILVGAIVGAVLFDTARAVTGTTSGGPAAAAADRHPAITVATLATRAPGHRDLAHPFTVTVRAATGDPAAATTVPTTGHRHDAGIPDWARDAAGGTCHVERGDNLWNLAEEHLGDPHRWREIYLLNRGHRQANGHALSDPDDIDVGWVLALPAAHPDTRPAYPPASHQPTRPTHPQSPPRDPVTPPTAHPTNPSPAATRPDQQTTSASPPAPAEPSTRNTGSPSASAPAAPAPDGEHDDGQAPSARPIDGIGLPGGWITPGLGAALLAAVAMVWRRRRNRYKPTPITKPHLDDPDLLPPLAAMTRIRAGLRRLAPETLDEQPAAAPTVREYQNAAVKPELPPIGPSGSELAGAATLPLSSGLGLTGEGALDAARGLLVATLAAGSDDDPDAKGQAIIPASTLATLLGASAVDLGHLDRLTVTDTEADAITALEEEIIRRSRLIADAQVADVHTLRDTDVHAEPMPQLLLIAELPDPAWTNRLITAVRLGQAVDVGAGIIGEWPSGTTLDVAADGTTGSDTSRLSVLDTATTLEALGLLREAHGDTDGPVRLQHPVRRTDAEPAHEGNRESKSPEHPVAPPPTAAPTAEDGPPPVAVRVLGRPAVLDADGQPSTGIRSQAVELLVYLAVNRAGADLSDIMEALYPDATMRRASQRLSTVVADLRKHIRRAAATPADTSETLRKRLEPIPNTGSRYHLDPAVVRVDWWTVLDEYERVAATTDPGQQLAHLTTAIDATGGALAEGADYDWIGTDREAVRRHRLKLYVHAAALLADTDPHRSWLLLEQACEIDPLSDEFAQAAMRAAATLGDADAIRHRLKTLREALVDHRLEVTDDTETVARDLLRQLHPSRTSE
jgi:two-component SAPR family response regulator